MPTRIRRFRAAPLALLATALLGLLPVRPSAADAPPVQDVCVGNGSAGPYTLSWQHVLIGTEAVRVNGLPQMRGLDYTLDADAGALTFTRSLPAQSAIAVTYRHDPAQAARNGQGQTIPLSVDLLRGERGYFSFNALGTTGDGSQRDLTLGVGMGLNGGPGAQVSTRFFYAPVTAGADAPAASPWQRAGLTVAGSAQAGGWAQFSFGLARAGVGLGATGDGGPQAGQESLTLGSRLTLTRQVQAQWDYAASRPTDAAGAATATTTSLALTVSPSDRAQVQADLTRSGTGAGAPTQTLALSATAQPTDKMQVSASYNDRNAPGPDNDSRAVALKTVLTPGKTLSLETDAGQTKSGTDTTDRQAVTLTLTPRAALQLDAGLSLRQQETAGADPVGTAVASVGGTLHPLSFLEFSGRYQSRLAPVTDTRPGDTLDTSAAQVALSPLKSLRLVGAYAQNPTDDNNVLQRLAKRGLGLETSLGALGLSGGCDWSRSYDSPDIEETVHADLGLRFSAATRLSVGYQARQNRLDPAALPDTAYTVGFTHALGDRFSVSLSGKRQQSAASQAAYDASANLGMKF